MHSLRAPLAWLLLAGVSALAQAPVPQSTTLADFGPPPAGTRRTAAELEQLLAPIALYPDALIALILPASTAPTDIVLAARQIRETGVDRSQIEHRAWDESVKSLTHYPDVLKWMDENLQWTKQAGEAFAEQPVEVMQAVQRLRAQARAAGTLVDTPQHQVLTDREVIRIVPAQADAIYVPYYDPVYVFADRPSAYDQPYVSFGVGLPVGAWLAFEFDWRRHQIWMGNRHRHWTGHDWHRPMVPIPIVAPAYAAHPEVRPWRPSVPPVRQPRPLPYQTASRVVPSAPSAVPRTSGFAPIPAPARPATGLPVQPRRVVVPPQNLGGADQVSSANVVAPRSAPRAVPPVTGSATQPAPHAHSRPRPLPAPAPAPAAAITPATAPAPAAAPTTATAPAPATRPEGGTERSGGRRSPNER